MVVSGSIPYTPVVVPIQFITLPKIKATTTTKHGAATCRECRNATDLGSPSHYSVHGVAEEKKGTA
jgi:hypothetical protein